MRYLLLFSILLFVQFPLTAQTIVELDSIEVTASRITSTISESGKNVSVITRRDIEQMPVNSVDEMIRSIPGININSRQGFGVQADVGMRGSTYSQVLFMLDNVPLNDPLTAHFNTNIPVSLSEIGQVEIIRGPASASFGADAVGGVVHIKTISYMEREIASQPDSDLITRVHADAAFGQHALQMGDLAVELQGERWRATVSGRYIDSDGERLRNPGFEAGISDESHYQNYFYMSGAAASFSYRISDSWSFYTRGGIDDRDFSARYFYTRNAADEATEQIRNHWILSSITRSSENHRTELNSSIRRVNDTFDFNSRLGIPANEHTTDLSYLNLSHQVETGGSERLGIASSRIMAGVQTAGKRIESTDRGNHSDQTGGVYLIQHLKTENNISLTASARLQFNETGPAEFLPQLSASYTVGQFIFRGSAGRAIRTGDYTERYVSSQIPDLDPGRNIGNPNLLAERSFTYDAGFDWQPFRRTRISPTFFYRNSENLIDYILTNSSEITTADNLQDDEEYFYAQNISQTRATGVELIVGQQISLFENWSAGIDGGYTYILTDSDDGEVSKYIANHPSHQYTLGIRLSGNRVSINSQSSYRVRSPESADLAGAEVPERYFLTDLNLSYSPAGYPFSLYVKGMNLSNTKYQEILGAPMPGRWMMGGVRWSM